MLLRCQLFINQVLRQQSRSMKFLILLSLFIFQTFNMFSQDNSLVLIKHIGSCDKPIPSVFIYLKSEKNNYIIDSILNSEKMGGFLNKIETELNINSFFSTLLKKENDLKYVKANKSTSFFGSFEFCFYRNDNGWVKRRFILDRKYSLILFKSIVVKLNRINNSAENNKLIEIIEYLIKRIE